MAGELAVGYQAAAPPIISILGQKNGGEPPADLIVIIQFIVRRDAGMQPEISRIGLNVKIDAVPGILVAAHVVNNDPCGLTQESGVLLGLCYRRQPDTVPLKAFYLPEHGLPGVADR